MAVSWIGFDSQAVSLLAPDLEQSFQTVCGKEPVFCLLVPARDKYTAQHMHHANEFNEQPIRPEWRLELNSIYNELE